MSDTSGKMREDEPEVQKQTKKFQLQNQFDSEEFRNSYHPARPNIPEQARSHTGTF